MYVISCLKNEIISAVLGSFLCMAKQDHNQREKILRLLSLPGPSLAIDRKRTLVRVLTYCEHVVIRVF